ncbi:hypothetical protein AaE_015648 [Aphanomyces astaci]|uniref:ATP-dependent DNA helicase n=1 Tax=Aphanomyces astaci TaxID=112090 RepID=A0A6A4YYU5_APHAT|nr:hypothetical protein AaE_015648 [Aphanomyces astaci]
MSKKRVERVVTFENQSRVEESSEASVAWSTDPPGEIPTLVQVNVPGALDPSTMLYTGNLVERGKVPQALPDYAHIGVVSSAFGLRMRQHLSFTCIARALLQRWQLEDNGDHDPRSVATATSAIQLRMVLHGEGGTGKSHVIAAVQTFCNSWKRPFSIAKTAMTGKAAVSINGVTLHSWIGMHNLTPSTVHEAKEADEKGVPGYTEDLKLLLVDEMSMMNKQQLVRLDEALRARTKLDLPFGGINIVLTGDFFQMPPVGGKPLYTPLSAYRGDLKFDLYEDTGFHLWRSFKDVVVLNENVRFSQDPEWGRYVSLARKGEWRQELVDILNSRILSDGLVLKSMVSPNVSTPSAPPSQRCTTYTTPDNRTRQAIINAYTAALSTKLPRNHYPIRVVANFNGRLNGLSSKDISDIMSLPDTKLGNMAPFIDLIPGMPVVFTQNVNPQHGIANGTFGTLHSVQFNQTTKFKLVEDAGSKLKVLIPNSPPAVVFVRVTRPKNFDVLPRDGLHDSLPADVYPVFMFKPQGSTEVTLTPGPGGSKRTLKLNLLQLPFVNAIASTIYKIQGETMESLVVADWKARGSKFNKVVNTCQQGYIAISRLTKRDGFSALKPLTNECIRYFQPSNDTIAENLRLEQLFALYLSRNENTAVFNSSDFNALKMTLPEAPVAVAPLTKRKLCVLDPMESTPATNMLSMARPKRSVLDRMEKRPFEVARARPKSSVLELMQRSSPCTVLPATPSTPPDLGRSSSKGSVGCTEELFSQASLQNHSTSIDDALETLSLSSLQ